MSPRADDGCSVDTNVVVRYLVADDPAQAAKARELFRRPLVWIAKTVLLETEWVLRSLYGFGGPEIARSLQGLLGLPNVTAEDPPTVALALNGLAQGMDFADALHLASAPQQLLFVTFDRRLAKRRTNQNWPPIELS